MVRLNNIKPKKAEKFLVSHGWESVNRQGSHVTLYKKIDGRDCFCQVIYNNKTIYWRNVKVMIKKSHISEKKWIEEFGR